jgi:tRNA(Arg) A34 adenosine deaminase TadA
MSERPPELRPAPTLAERIAGALAGPAGGDLAFLEDRGRVFFARALEPGPFPPSPVFRLVHGIYEVEPERARWIVRRRIFSTAPPGPLCSGTVKVAARRLSAPIAPAAGFSNGSSKFELAFENHACAPRIHADLALVDVGGASLGRDLLDARPPATLAALLGDARPRGPADFMRAALALADAIPAGASRYRSDRRVAALLVSADGELLAAAVNTNARNRTLHAEVNLVAAHARRARAPIPPGARIYTTLKPCRMCAGLIWCAAADVASLRVFYAQDDPGPGARETVLDPRTLERRRASRSAAELDLRLQAPLAL